MLSRSILKLNTPCQFSHACLSLSRPHVTKVRATGSTPESPTNRIGFPYASILDLTEGALGCTDADHMIEMLSPMLMDGRLERIQRIVSQRSFSVLPIVEGVYNMGNLAAVCRSADAFGFGAVHCINTTSGEYKQSSRTSAGAEKWLNVSVWESGTRETLTRIKNAGYQLVVTHLSKSSVTIQDIDWTKPTAFVLGNEREGVSEEALAQADYCAVIPMAGFVESFNISVAAALIMYEAHNQRLKKLGCNGDLSEEEQKLLVAALMLRSVREGPTVIKELLSRPPQFWQKRSFKRQFAETRGLEI